MVLTRASSHSHTGCAGLLFNLNAIPSSSRSGQAFPGYGDRDRSAVVILRTLLRTVRERPG